MKHVLTAIHEKLPFHVHNMCMTGIIQIRPVTSCQEMVQSLEPYGQERKQSAPLLQSSCADFDLAPVSQLVLEETQSEAKSINNTYMYSSDINMDLFSRL